MRRRSRDPGEPSALDLLEEAVLLLSDASPAAWATYALGTIPFLVVALLAGFDLARDGGVARSLPIASLGLAILFTVMKTEQAAFCDRLRSEGLGAAPGGRAGLFEAASRQAALQPWGILLVPLSFLATVPFGWTYAFFQNVLAEGRTESGLRALVSRAGRQAGLWPAQNHLVLLILFAFRLFVFLDVLVLLLALPFLLRVFTGVETQLARAGASLVSIPLVLTGLAVSYVLVDPLVKAVYVLRCYHGESRRTGEDLLAALARRTAPLVTLLLLTLPAAAAAPSVDPERLDRSLTEVLARRRFAWHLPKERETETTNAFEDLVQGLWELLASAARALWKLADRLARWIGDRFSRGSGKEPVEATGLAALLDARLLLLVVLAVVATLGALFLYRTFRRRKRPAPVAVATASTEVDLLSETIQADEKEPDEWLSLGREWLERGDARRALRALYLAGLGALAKGQLVRLAPHKSNGDYLGEVARRSPASSELPATFAAIVREFDAVWYGDHAVSGESLTRFEAVVLEVRALAAR